MTSATTKSTRTTLRSELDATKSALATVSTELATTAAELAEARAKHLALQRQLDWFKRQLFEPKSERVLPDPAVQPSLFPVAPPPPPESPPQTVTYTRRAKQRSEDCVSDTGLRFDPSVPVETVIFPVEGDGEVIDEKVTFKLAQRPGAYVVLKLVRPVRRHGQQVVKAPAPTSVVEGSLADVSFLVGMLIDKFLYHLPFYRQHQRLQDQGITVARSTFTHLAKRTISLLEPIYQAQLDHIRQSQVILVDETPIKVGRKGDGKMNTGYFWPLRGEDNEVCFPFANGRQHSVVPTLLGKTFTGTLVTDGYAAYDSYVAACNTDATVCTHAHCWSHTRREFEQALRYAPEAAGALDLIRELYKHEKAIVTRGLSPEQALAYRGEHSRPVVDAFWRWCYEQKQRMDLVPKEPLAMAVEYAWTRKQTLQVFLADPAVPLDTNAIERDIRPIALGRRNFLFCWTELGAKHVGVIQSLLQTCRAQGVDAYTYLVDVLQRIDVHPNSRVSELTPRLWKQHFASEPFRSFVDLGMQSA